MLTISARIYSQQAMCQESNHTCITVFFFIPFTMHTFNYRTCSVKAMRQYELISAVKQLFAKAAVSESFHAKKAFIANVLSASLSEYPFRLQLVIHIAAQICYLIIFSICIINFTFPIFENLHNNFIVVLSVLTYVHILRSLTYCISAHVTPSNTR